MKLRLRATALDRCSLFRRVKCRFEKNRLRRAFSAALAIAGGLALSSCKTETPQAPPYTQTSYAAPTQNKAAEAPTAAPTTWNAADNPPAADVTWPCSFNDGNRTITVYEPVVDSWNGGTLVARSAVAVQSPGQPQPVYGALTFKAITLVDKTTQTVSLRNVEVVSGDFPRVADRGQDYVRQLRTTFPNHVRGLPLDRLQTALAAPEPAVQEHPLENTPPKIIFSTRPAVLVYIDGPAVYRPVAGTDLQRVINTRVLLLKDTAGRHYLHMLDGYLEAPSLGGPWTVAAAPPKGAATAEQQARDSGQVDLLQASADEGQPPSLRSAPAPVIYVETVPSELVTFEGEPNYLPIPGTHLLYAANTSGNVFKLLTDQQTYVLLSGRWFRGAALEGPWQFVSGNQLPRDFSDIPDNSPKENVKASVAGTPQASEALIANSIPQTTAVPRVTPMEPPQIDGPPRLEPITGTPLFYVVNSGTPIVKVDDHTWYACQNGVWYVATSMDGPWEVATSVPAVIYTIPPSSPLHYLTYVRVYGSGTDVVYDGYTPGYLGTEVQGGVVVYGTGYYYAPWVGAVWFGPPVTWGFGWCNSWTPWWGWYWGCGFGWPWGFGPFGWWCHPFPWWGPFPHFVAHGPGLVVHRTAWASTAANVYRPGTRISNRSTAGAANRWQANYGRAYNSRTGQITVGQRGQVQNVYRDGWQRAGRTGFAPRNPDFARTSSNARNAGIVSQPNRAPVWYNPKSGQPGTRNGTSGGVGVGAGPRTGGGPNGAPRGGVPAGGGGFHGGEAGGGGGFHGGGGAGGGGGGGGGHGGGRGDR